MNVNRANHAVHLVQASTDSVPVSARAFLRLLGRLQHGNLQVMTPRGTLYMFGDTHQPAGAILKINDWRACLRILRAGDIGFAEALQAGWVDSPDLAALIRLALRNQATLQKLVDGGPIARLWFRLRHLLRANTRKGSRKNIHAHYDIGNDFYQLWLDSSMTYSSALFEGNRQMSLAEAQCRKYQRIIDRLGLQHGDHVLEIGCGWGGFAVHAAQQGIRVTGVTISEAQLAIARQRTQQFGEQVQLSLCDYRDLQGQYDAVVSIEMFEAVGERYWAQYFAVIQRLLKVGGKAMVQSITIGEQYFDNYRRSADFIQQYIFPGGMLPSRERFAATALREGMAVSEEFCFGPDYAETLRRWRDAWEASESVWREQGFDERFARIWRLYFAYCEAGFEEGKTDVVQFLLQKA